MSRRRASGGCKGMDGGGGVRLSGRGRVLVVIS